VVRLLLDTVRTMKAERKDLSAKPKCTLADLVRRLPDELQVPVATAFIRGFWNSPPDPPGLCGSESPTLPTVNSPAAAQEKTDKPLAPVLASQSDESGVNISWHVAPKLEATRARSNRAVFGIREDYWKPFQW